MEPYSRKEIESFFRIAADVAIGTRPAGGDFILKIADGPKWVTQEEFRFGIQLVETVEGKSSILLDRQIPSKEWIELLSLAIYDWNR